jgi:glycosyltransferase involved in cell wall biosynthesis
MESAPVMQPPATIDGEPLDLTFVVLAYNEEGGLRPTVENCIAWMRHARRVVSILIMNDGSTDGTRAIADELARQYPNVRAHHMPKNVGQFSVLRTAWGIVDTTYYAAIPGDNQFDMLSFDMFVPHIGRYDVVLGFPNNEEVRGRFRAFLSYLWRIYLLGLYGISMVYLAGLVVVPVDLVRRVETGSAGFLGWYETMVRICLSGATVIQIPFVMREREGGESKAFNPTRNLRDLAEMALVWSKIKGPGMFPAGKEWARLRDIYLEYRAANPLAKDSPAARLHETLRPRAPT